MKTIYKLFVLPTLLILVSNAGFAQSNRLFSVFVYNFTKYLEWPPPNDDFTIIVYGNSKVYEELQTMVLKKKVNGKPIILKKVNNLLDIEGCSMFYISDNKSREIKHILSKIKDKPILLVGEQEGLTKKGFGISLYLNEDDNVEFEINKKAIENQQLKVSSALLKLASQ